ncbi:MAG: hypothetical protein WC994_05085 [Brumimicrobium sp.]
MSKEKLFKELITEMAKDGEISSSEYTILLEKGKDLGFTQKTIDLLIKIELSDLSSKKSSDFRLKSETNSPYFDDDKVYRFRSAITRGGSILTPDIIEIKKHYLIYRKRNKYLINVDSTSIPISKIASVELDTSIWGTDIIVHPFGSNQIICRRFSLSDARKVKRLIEERQGLLRS